jgi:RNA-splicing ligase RtcB
MSRTEAAGKKRKRWSCTNRECSWRQKPNTHKPGDSLCPYCASGLKKNWVQEKEGRINWSAANEDLQAKGIVLRGGAPDEAPKAYKRLTDVLASQGETITVTETLHPIGVAMAGPDVNDPFKD